MAEALHMDVPCISTRVGFAAEFLPEGALMEADSVDELVRGLKLAMEDPDGLRAMLKPSFELVAREQHGEQPVVVLVAGVISLVSL